MTTQLLLYFIVAVAIVGYIISRKRASTYKKNLQKNESESRSARLHSLPKYFGYYTAMCAGIPSLILFLLWLSLEGTIIDSSLKQHIPESMAHENISLVLNNVKLAASSGEPSAQMKPLADFYTTLKTNSAKLKVALVGLMALAGLVWGYTRFSPVFRARNNYEKQVETGLILCSIIAILTTVGIVLSLLFNTISFFRFDEVTFLGFLFGTEWSPTGHPPQFGVIPLFVGTLLIALIALIIAIPIGLMSAIYLSEYANTKARSFFKPVLELLAGIPTVVYGFFAALTVAPMFRNFGDYAGISISSESAMVAGVVMGMMIIPFISSLSDDAISAVPQYLRDGSLGLGATQSETIRQVILPAALPGIIGGILLAASRVIGETMIVVMAAGMGANLTWNPLETVTTVTVQIVALLTGDQEFDSAKTYAVFALALLLFFVTLLLNTVALRIVKKYREQYD